MQHWHEHLPKVLALPKNYRMLSEYNNDVAFPLTWMRKIIQYSHNTTNYILFHFIWMVSMITMNLINEIHHSCERMKYVFIILCLVVELDALMVVVFKKI